MATLAEGEIEQAARQTRALIRYVDPGDFLTRRYVSQGRELNTGAYNDHEVIVRDGMPIRDHFTLDRHGFVLVKSRSAIADFHDKDAVDALYEREVEREVLRLTGADKAAARGWMIRTSGDLTARAKEGVAGYTHRGGIQPPAGEAHVDTNEATARRMAERAYRENFPDGPGFKRFLVSSFWRAFSPGPQDMPLAVCDGRSSFGGEEKNNTMIIADQLPDEAAAALPIEGEDKMIAATIFSYHPGHRWWYFSNMRADDALLFKFYDSDHSVTWRCPHTAFRDSSFPDAKVRESIEVRSVAFWE